MTPKEFAPGFRLSASDVLVMALGIIATTLVGSRIWWAGMIIGFVVGHFFLFCNVFRISRKSELIWAAVFIMLSTSTITTGAPGWTWTVIISLVLTAGLVWLEMKKPSYHGILWKRINPGLEEWWGRNAPEPAP